MVFGVAFPNPIISLLNRSTPFPAKAIGFSNFLNVFPNPCNLAKPFKSSFNEIVSTTFPAILRLLFI